MTAFLISRARRLFHYANLIGSSTPAPSRLEEWDYSTATNVRESVGMGSGDDPNDSAQNLNMKRKKQKRFMMMVGTVVFGCAAFVVIVTVLSGGHLHRHSFDLPEPEVDEEDSVTDYWNTASDRSEERRKKKYITLHDVIRSDKFFPKTFNGSWISDTEYLYHSFLNSLEVTNVEDPSRGYTLMSSSMMSHLNPLSYELSPDRKYLLMKRTHHTEFRRSFHGIFSILEVKPDGRPGTMLQELMPTITHEVETEEDKLMRGELRNVKWAPKGNALAFVDYYNNLFYRPSVLALDYQLTQDGDPGEIYNGIPDWVFEEEVFEDNSALWWSPDSMKLLWGKFDDTNVDSYLLPEYGSWKHVQQYPGVKLLHYPKVNRTNPIQELWLADFTTLNRRGKGPTKIHKVQVFPPSSMSGEETHFSSITWADDDHFSVTWFNRVGNRAVITLCHFQIKKPTDCSSHDNEILVLEESNGYLEHKYHIHFNPSPPNPEVHDFIVLLPAPFIAHHYQQIVHVAAGSRTFLTQLEADVVKILRWSSDGYIYYVSTLPDEPGSRHIFYIPSPTQTLSVDTPHELVASESDTESHMAYLNRMPCSYYEVSMSKNAGYFAMTCLGPDIPWSCLHRTATREFVAIIEENKEVEAFVSEYHFPTVHDIKVPVKASDQMARVKLLLPPGFDRGKKYPLVVNVYGGPGSQSVSSDYDAYGYNTYLSGSENMVYATVDPKGSGYQGTDWKFSIYKGFGTAEVDSTLEVIKYLQANLSYVDAERTAIWGWSYGGFLSLSVLSRDTEGVVQCGVSVAPVVDWTLYDTYYTERYMGLLDENFPAYNYSSVFHYLDGLKTKKFLLMHGSHDDNVHFQQSMLLSAALESKDILFQQHVYPDQAHSIARYRMHLYHTLTDFLKKSML